MIIHHQRHFLHADYTYGILTIGDLLFCLLLEDTVRQLKSIADKIPGKTAIPAGLYPLVVEYSDKFKKLMAEIKDVTFFSETKYHCGASADDSLGCPLMGLTRPSPEKIYGGIQNKLTEKLVDILQKNIGPHFVRITDP